MNEKADIWIFYAQRDKEFGGTIAEKIRADIPDRIVKTSNDLGEAPPLMPNIEPSNIVLLVLSGSRLGGWFAANVADTITSRTRNILILLRRRDVELPAILSGCRRYDFTDDIEFDKIYKQLIQAIMSLLKEN